jgi:hypothetical protein
MSNDALHERGEALEELFYRNRDAQLLERIKTELQVEEDRTALAHASGIKDDKTLSDLLAQGIRHQTLASVGLIPLVAVAWADGRMETREREAVLKAARETGLSDDDSSMEILRSWLDKRPGHELLAAWKEYIGELKKTLAPAAFDQVHHSVVGRARIVAESAGGFMGIVNTVAPNERAIIKELHEAFNG